MHRKRWAELQAGAVWHGHNDDLARLVYCLAVNCSCGSPNLPGEARGPCSVHHILGEQHTLDHLAFARGMRQRLLRSEWVLDGEPEDRWTAQLKLERVQRRQRQIPEALVCIMAGLIVLFGLSGPFTPQSPNVSPLASWQAR